MRLTIEQRRRIDRQRIPFDHAQPARIGITQFGKRGDAASVTLDRGDARAGGEQRAGKAAGTWPHLQHLLVLQVARHGRDARQELSVEEEVLPERLAGR